MTVTNPIINFSTSLASSETLIYLHVVYVVDLAVYVEVELSFN